jgi:antitoxin component YwqK of YwqJK toxin-antitoxin module
MCKIKFIFILFLFFSCNAKRDEGIKEYYSNGIPKSILVKIIDSAKQYTYFEYYPTGFLKSIQSLKNDTVSGQLISFHENGMLEKKIIVDSKGVSNGMAYWFYPNGVLKSIRNYQNGIEVGLGGDYWNKPYGIIQSSFLFNDSGKIFYKMNYDSNGIFLHSEGKRPDYWKGD